ncbi:tRNA (cytidine(56)-2'-O)-methyltransferase [Candidatus Bilamarchaeum dharawalense]|uniref:tRNA (cytidine(56)-2'-O)-methyltransferase n=1 Tax=Candidatus Bilamarchaeum dharawalense TaxID=2885759 RepID=A0A5E4LPA8_9ARCH|nr:tRNA (cytidine(56)-2'-O)-methyltransferase [Candidatus Bilamarchaeum dharawalense]
MEIFVLRLSHRLPRDERISTHVCLVARAFGANSVVYSGQHDSGLEESVKKICASWGGQVEGSAMPFDISYEKNALKFMRECKASGYSIIHLTMYGLPLPEKLNEIKNSKKLLIVVGSEQVPGEVYELADFNISVTNQPHSEVAALAITLDRIVNGRELTKEHSWSFGSRIKIEPCAKGKKFRKS